MIWIELLPTLDRENAMLFRCLLVDATPNKAMQWSGVTGGFQKQRQLPPPTDRQTFWHGGNRTRTQVSAGTRTPTRNGRR